MAVTSTLKDNFSSNSVDTNKWTVTQTVGTVRQLMGQLVITLAANTSEYNKIASVSTYDLTGSYIMVKQEALVAGSSTEQQLIVQIDESNKIVLFYSNGGMVCRYNAGAGNNDTFPGYSATRDIWWRIRESGGTTYWETSPDSVTWTTLRSATNPITVTALTIELQAGNYDALVATPGRAVFAHFNLPAYVDGGSHFTVGQGMSRSEFSK